MNIDNLLSFHIKIYIVTEGGNHLIGKLIDIRMLNGQMLAIKTNLITSKEVEQTINSIRYHGEGLIKDEAVENAKLPSIAQTFYEYLFVYGIPTPEQLIEAYLRKHFILTGNYCKLPNSSSLYLIDGVKARVYRTYPSLLRDFHFYLLCCESNLFEKVYYSLKSDIYEGIDLRVTYQGQLFAVALFVQTPRSKSYKQKKYFRHQPLNIPEICLEIDPFDKQNYVGDFALYQPSHVQLLLERIQSYLSNFVPVSS